MVNDFLNRTPIPQEIIKKRIDKYNCIKLRSSAHERKQLTEQRDSLHNGRYSPDKELISRI
jgi:hypothetical protein